MRQLSSSELNNMSKEDLAAMILQIRQLPPAYAGATAQMDDTDMNILEDLLPWLEKLPEECRKKF